MNIILSNKSMEDIQKQYERKQTINVFIYVKQTDDNQYTVSNITFLSDINPNLKSTEHKLDNSISYKTFELLFDELVEYSISYSLFNVNIVINQNIFNTLTLFNDIIPMISTCKYIHLDFNAIEHNALTTNKQSLMRSAKKHYVTQVIIFIMRNICRYMSSLLLIMWLYNDNIFINILFGCIGYFIADFLLPDKDILRRIRMSRTSKINIHKLLNFKVKEG